MSCFIAGIYFVLISVTSCFIAGILSVLRSVIAALFWLTSNFIAGILFALISLTSCFIAVILLLLISLILLKLLEMSCLFCDISIRCSFVVVKQEVDKVVLV
jgi:hypothetical protein